jgi:hypothetical protein
MGSLRVTDYIALAGSAATAITALIALFALVYAKDQVREAQKQLQHSRKIANLDALLRLDEAFQRHAEVHKLLQPNFGWGRNKGGPKSDEEWFMVTSYMGLFERVNFLIDIGIEELAMIDKFHGYRVFNIVSNDIIRQAKLEDERLARYWQEFIKLWLKLKDLHSDWDKYPKVTLV